MQPFKVKVTPAESAQLQAALFAHGITWVSGDTEILYVNSPYLYMSKSGKLTRSNSGPTYFNLFDAPEKTFAELMAKYGPANMLDDLKAEVAILQKRIDDIEAAQAEPEHKVSSGEIWRYETHDGEFAHWLILGDSAGVS